MVSALDSGDQARGPRSSLGWGTALCSWTRNFTLILPLFTQVYKWVSANLLQGVTLQWNSIPSIGFKLFVLPFSVFNVKDTLPVVFTSEVYVSRHKAKGPGLCRLKPNTESKCSQLLIQNGAVHIVGDAFCREREIEVSFRCQNQAKKQTSQKHFK